MFLATNDRIIVVDPMGEYAPLVRRLGRAGHRDRPGQPHTTLNRLWTLQMNINDEDSPLSMKADFLLSLCELMRGRQGGLAAHRDKPSLTAVCGWSTGRWRWGWKRPKTPLLQDLYEELLQPAGAGGAAGGNGAGAVLHWLSQPLSTILPMSGPTIPVWSALSSKGLGENLRKIAMHTTNEFVTAAVNANSTPRAWRLGATLTSSISCSVIQLTASYFVAVWKMLRKKGCVPSALTQNVKDLLASREIENDSGQHGFHGAAVAGAE